MTKEELEKEAEEVYQKRDREFMDCQDEGEVFNLGYIAGAEPREKRIEELEVKIEKMKCCQNCKSYDMNYLPYYCNKKREPKHCYEKCEEWEIKENG